MKGLLIASLLVLSITVNAQLSKQDYIQKSKNQRTFAWILTGGGVGMVIGGVVLIASEPNYVDYGTIGGALIGGGAVAIAGGIVLFSAAKKNERKADEVAFQLHVTIGSARQYEDIRIVNKYYPALTFSISLP